MFHSLRMVVATVALAGGTALVLADPVSATTTPSYCCWVKVGDVISQCCGDHGCRSSGNSCSAW